MTTIAAPQERTPRVLRAGALGVLATTAVVTLAALAAADAAAVRSALLGGTLVVAFFAFGAVNVGIAARIVPAAAMLVALVSYTFQVVLVLLVFIGLRRSDAFEGDLTEGWLAGSLIAGTFVWMLAQVVTTLRTPIPPWEGPAEQPVPSQEGGAA
jgi:ATP synthase protein I